MKVRRIPSELANPCSILNGSGNARNSDGENQERDEDCPRKNLHPEVGTSINRSPQLITSDPVEVFYMVGVVHEEKPHCRLGNRSGKQMKMGSFFKPQLGSENNPVLVEAD